MAKTITYPDSGGSFVRKGDGKLDPVHVTEQLPAPAEQKDAVAPADAPAAPSGEVTKTKEGK